MKKNKKEFDAVDMVRKIRDEQGEKYFKNRKRLFSDLARLAIKKKKAIPSH